MQHSLTLPLHPSWRLAAALFFAHGAALFCWLMVDLPMAGRLAGAAVLVASLSWQVSRHAWRPPLTALHLKTDGSLELTRRAGDTVCARMLPDSTVFSWLIVLRLEVAGRTVALTLPADALPGDTHRQLRLWLRWQADATVS